MFLGFDVGSQVVSVFSYKSMPFHFNIFHVSKIKNLTATIRFKSEMTILSCLYLHMHNFKSYKIFLPLKLMKLTITVIRLVGENNPTQTHFYQYGGPFH